MNSQSTETRTEKVTPHARFAADPHCAAGTLLACIDFDAGHALFEQGDDFVGFYWLESGLVGLRKINEDGSAMLVSLVRPGDFIGYSPLFDDKEHLVSAVVLQRSRVACIVAKRQHTSNFVHSLKFRG